MVTGDMMRIGIVGYGNIARKHIEVFRALGCEIAASCNRSEAGRERAQQEGQILAVYSDIDKMLQDANLDGVLCCASFTQLYETACKIIPTQTPVLIEKPPGLSMVELAKLESLATEYNTPVMVGMNRRHYSVVERAVEDMGGLDAVTSVSVQWSEDYRRFLERGYSLEEASKLIFANSLHGLDLLTYFAGHFEAPQALVKKFSEPLGVTMSLSGISDRGVLGHFNSTWNSPGRWRLDVCTNDRRYIFAPLESCRVQEVGVKGERIIEPAERDTLYKAGFFKQAELFCELVRTREDNSRVNLASTKPPMHLAGVLTDLLPPTG
jgi:predicted dehydrogenase